MPKLTPGSDPKGIMSPMGHTCDGRIGGKKEKNINPDALPISGRYSGMSMDADGGDGRTSGLGSEPPRSGYFGSK